MPGYLLTWPIRVGQVACTSEMHSRILWLCGLGCPGQDLAGACQLVGTQAAQELWSLLPSVLCQLMLLCGMLALPLASFQIGTWYVAR